MLFISLNFWRKMFFVEVVIFSVVVEKVEVYFLNIARLSSNIRINSVASTVLVIIIGVVILFIRRIVFL